MNIETFQTRLREIMESYTSGFEAIDAKFSTATDTLFAEGEKAGIDDDLMSAVISVEQARMLIRIDETKKARS